MRSPRLHTSASSRCSSSSSEPNPRRRSAAAATAGRGRPRSRGARSTRSPRRTRARRARASSPARTRRRARAADEAAELAQHRAVVPPPAVDQELARTAAPARRRTRRRREFEERDSREGGEIAFIVQLPRALRGRPRCPQKLCAPARAPARAPNSQARLSRPHMALLKSASAAAPAASASAWERPHLRPKAGGQAELDGLLCVGDEIVAIDGALLKAGRWRRRCAAPPSASSSCGGATARSTSPAAHDEPVAKLRASGTPLRVLRLIRAPADRGWASICPAPTCSSACCRAAPREIRRLRGGRRRDRRRRRRVGDKKLVQLIQPGDTPLSFTVLRAEAVRRRPPPPPPPPPPPRPPPQGHPRRTAVRARDARRKQRAGPRPRRMQHRVAARAGRAGRSTICSRSATRSSPSTARCSTGGTAPASSRGARRRRSGAAATAARSPRAWRVSHPTRRRAWWLRSGCARAALAARAPADGQPRRRGQAWARHERR